MPQANEASALPLAGVRVLELGRLFAAPMCGQILGDLGADVVKVERRGGGDDFRSYGPPFLIDAEGQPTRDLGSYLACNRNKRSISVDFSLTGGQRLICDLARHSDILIENFKVGTLERYGLGYEQLRAESPGLIYLSVTGFGQTGPYRDRPGTDGCFQAMSGLQSLTGQPDGPPEKVGMVIVDMVTGLYSTIAALAALRHRDTGRGQGQQIDMALLDCAIAATSHRAIDYLMTGSEPQRMGNAQPGAFPSRFFDCRDGRIHIQASVDSHFARMCEALGLGGVAADPRFATRLARRDNQAEITAILEPVFAGLSLEEAYDILVEADVICGPVYSVPQALADRQVQSRGLVVDVPHPAAGSVRLLKNPIRFSETPLGEIKAPPMLGADTREVLSEWLGMEGEAADALEAGGIV